MQNISKSNKTINNPIKRKKKTNKQKEKKHLKKHLHVTEKLYKRAEILKNTKQQIIISMLGLGLSVRVRVRVSVLWVRAVSACFRNTADLSSQ